MHVRIKNDNDEAVEIEVHGCLKETNFKSLKN